MTDERGLAALAAELGEHTRQFSDGSWLLLFDDKGYPHPTVEKFAAAILGERGVFLPDGLPAYVGQMAADAIRDAATITTLRAALTALRERVTGLPLLWDANVPIGDDPWEACRERVLAEIDRALEP
jgi:hypothetical protein